MPPRGFWQSIRTLLVPLGGTEADEIAIQLACETARRTNAQIFAIHVIEVRRTQPLDAELVPETRQGEEILGTAERAAQEMDYQIETELLQAREVGPAIVDEAAARGIDVIVMGMPYRLRFGEFTMGRTVPYVLEHAPCPLWICRLPQTTTGS